jgi:hypothetical protein
MFSNPERTIVSRTPKECNPRFYGSLEGIDFSSWPTDTDPETVVLKEYLHCKGLNGCQSHGNRPCATTLCWSIKYKNLNEVTIYRHGNHGDINFEPNPEKKGIPPLFLREIDQLILQGETASVIEKSVKTMNAMKLLGNIAAASHCWQP